MADTNITLMGKIADLPGALRTAACVNPVIELQMNAETALRLARTIERANTPPEPVIVLQNVEAMTSSTLFYVTNMLTFAAFTTLEAPARFVAAAIRAWLT